MLQNVNISYLQWIINEVWSLNLYDCYAKLVRSLSYNAVPILLLHKGKLGSQRSKNAFEYFYWWHHCSTCFIHKSPFHLPAVSLLLVFLVLRCRLWVRRWQASVSVLPSACYGFFFSRSKHSSLSGKLLCGDLIFFYNFYFILIPRHV